jgi:basic amino acid/polyamine antiporter, APA family
MLYRGIGKWDLVLLVINSIIGAGIFGVPSKVFALSGIYSLLAFVVCALVSMTFILCFAEVSSRFDKTGGPYIYTLSAFGRAPAFLVGWLLLIGRIFGYAAVVNLVAVYLSFFWPAFNSPIARIGCILFITAILTFINHIGIKNSTRFNNFLTIGKLAPLALFIIVGAFNLQPALFREQHVFSMPAFSDSILILVFVFGGYEAVLVNSGEISNPRKSLPFALITSTIIVTIFYCLIQAVCIGTLPSLATSEKPLADAANAFMGRTGATIVGIGAVISIIGNLNANIQGSSRIPFALSNENQFPKIFSFVHSRFLTPSWSIFAVSAIVATVSLLWSFLGALTIVSIIRILTFLAVCASFLKFRIKNKDESSYRIRFGYITAIAAILFSGWILASLDIVEIRDVSVFIVLGVIIYGINKKFQVKKGTAHMINTKH